MRSAVLIILIISFAFELKAQTEVQKKKVLTEIAQKDYRPTFSAIAARLTLGIRTNEALHQLDTLLKSEYGDMFWMYGCTGLYFSARDRLPAAYKKKIRECWKTFTPYRGDTENHFLMYYGSLYLMSQEWPKLPDTAWFMHRTSRQLHGEAEQYINYWINRTVRYGQIEFDSPRYLYYFITPLILLSEYSKDPAMKRKCEMMLEYLLAGYATKYLDGNYCGAHSRVGNDAAFDTRTTEAASYGGYFFEDTVAFVLPDIAFAAMSSFALPKIIREIVHDRKEPFGNNEIKRSRDALRYAKVLNTQVGEYTFMTKEYSLGSIGGGLVQPIQQRSWSLTINSPQKNNIIFGLHPYVSEKELGMFFPEEPSFMLEKIDAVKNGYTSENKWVGGSPYETISQYRNQIECTYDIPKDEKYQHVDIFLPGWGEFLEKDSSHVRILYDDCVVNIVPRTPFTLQEADGNYRMRLILESGKTSYSLVCNKRDEFNDFDESTNILFKDDLPQGLDKNDWLFYSKYLESKLGSAVLKMKYGSDERILDFSTSTIR
ncbi:MAG: hypothetical protein ABI778_09430 [Ignavibacteriota bacterium]